jgi:hypothetical protein
MVKPITPEEAADNKADLLPARVISAWNEVITKNFNGTSSTFTQDEIVQVISSKMKCPVEQCYKMKWLDVEPMYRRYGWDVTYDKPGYNESYSATFIFKKI